MRIDNICKLGNSGRIADVSQEARPLHIQQTTRAQHQDASKRAWILRRGNDRADREVQQDRTQGPADNLQLSPVGERQRLSTLRLTASTRKSIEAEDRSRAATRKINLVEITKLVQNCIDKFYQSFNTAPVASNDCGSLQDNLKTSHARSLMQPCYSTCEVFLRTVVA